MLRSIQEDYLKSGRDPDTINTTKLILGMMPRNI